MSESTRDLLVNGIAAAKAKSKDEARFYLEWILRSDADNDQLAEAWRWLAEITDDPQEKRNCLEQALAYNLMEPEARRELAILNRQLKPSDIVDPDHLPTPAAPQALQPIEARRFVCQQCGGRMAFAPDGNALICAYCNRRQSLITAMDEGAMLGEQDFTVTLATAKGHTRPVAVRALKCQGCGASFVLAPETLSLTCPYCASVYVVEQAETRELILPEGIVPFATTQDQARRAVLGWFRSEGLSARGNSALPIGVYLPVWTFDVGGQILWSCLQEENDVWVPRAGSKVVYENDLLVSASHTLSATLAGEINNFLLDGLAPYDPRYLADWPAETYQIPVGDASLVARWRILAKERPLIVAGFFEPVRDLRLNATRLVFESFKLILVPLWIAHYRDGKRQYTVVVNGQTGTVRGEEPPKGVRKWLSGLLGEG
jgi:DNA-directed RNA polymerase subunit RPC12/RpoP